LELCACLEIQQTPSANTGNWAVEGIANRGDIPAFCSRASSFSAQPKYLGIWITHNQRHFVQARSRHSDQLVKSVESRGTTLGLLNGKFQLRSVECCKRSIVIPALRAQTDRKQRKQENED
jgi:hypothetical protein